MYNLESIRWRWFVEWICVIFLDQDGIFRVVAAILHLGNVEFSKGNEADSSVPKDDKSRFHLKSASEMFM